MVGAAGLSVLSSRASTLGANEKIHVGLIGCGGMGNANLAGFMRAEQVEVVALCDVDRSRLDKTAVDVEKKYGRKPLLFGDYRKLIDTRPLDAVIIATPDHWHAICTMAACAAGKDVYVEKPCSHNIREGRAMVQAARKHKRVVQVGTQQRSGRHFQEAVEFIQSGRLGQVTMTATWIYGNESPAGMGNGPDSEPPPGVDYDMWLGPAPKRPFNHRRFHGTFRWYFDYAAGSAGDWNVHLQDVVHWAMKTPSPTSVYAAGGKFCLKDDRDTPDTLQAVYEFPGFVQTFTMRKASGLPWNRRGFGISFHGSNGTLVLDRESWKVIPDTQNEGDANSPLRCEKIDRAAGSYGDGDYWDQHWPHVKNFLECVRTRQRPAADIEINHRTAAACHLGNISLRLGRKLYWDPVRELCFQDANHKVTDEEANRQLGREYRKGYGLPAV
jgi:predicted dehydrogenase